MKSKLYARAKDVPPGAWKWRHFKPSEIASKDGPVMWDTDAMDKLEALRAMVGPIVLNSAYRTPAHNAKVGGAKNSMHLLAEAFDCQMKGHDPRQFEAAAREAGFTGFGFYPDQGFMHIDTGEPREWGERWPFQTDDPADAAAPPVATCKPAFNLKAKQARAAAP